MAPSSLTCPRDGTATQLTCIECDTPICPACRVRTEVGLKCPDDAADTVPGPAVREPGRPGGPPVTFVLGDAREIYALRLTAGISFLGMLVYDVPEGSTPTEVLLHDRPNNLMGRIGLAR